MGYRVRYVIEYGGFVTGLLNLCLLPLYIGAAVCDGMLGGVYGYEGDGEPAERLFSLPAFNPPYWYPGMAGSPHIAPGGEVYDGFEQVGYIHDFTPAQLETLRAKWRQE